MAAFLRRILPSRLVSLLLPLCLCLGLALTACSNAGLLSGNYVDDTVLVARSLESTIALGAEDPGRSEAETQARALINDYMSRYRPRDSVNGLASFTTMQTALNSLAGHYANYPNRPLPDSLRSRVDKELHQAEAGAVRGS
ncbi:MAG: photosystem II protein Psb27 [Synechococcaceae cyanobacterium]|nr:photosystem II protein Psb27 [Synechococcaceae cyanobacterium]